VAMLFTPEFVSQVYLSVLTTAVVGAAFLLLQAKRRRMAP